MMQPRAALYARVSTSWQEKEATIESQIAALENYAQQQGYHLAPEHYFIDQAVSGARLVRPALDRLRDLASETVFEVVLCLSPDRLARNYAHQQVLLDLLKQVGVEVIFVNQPRLGDSPQEQLLLGIQGLFAEYERTLISERMRRGKLHRLRQGNRLYPSPPYGYRYIPVSQPGGGRWEVEPRQAAVVRHIYQWYTNEGLAIRAIAARLNEQSALFPPPRDRPWTFGAVRRVLQQSAYMGRAYYNRQRACPEMIGRPRIQGRGYRSSRGYEPRPREEWIELQAPALIPEELWQQAQERSQMNQRFGQRNNKRHFYLLRGLLVCGVCGHTLVGRTRQSGVYYNCRHGGKNRSPDVPAHRCGFPGSVIEPLVWAAVSELLHNPTLLADAWQHQDTEGNALPDEEHRLKARQRSLERQWGRVLDVFQEGLIEKDELGQRKARLEEEKQAIAKRLQQLAQQVQRERVQEQILEDFDAFCQRIEAALASPTPEVQREVIRLLIDHIMVEEDALVIKHIVPTDDDGRLSYMRYEAWK
jgi:site-specific DNA recombinase